MPADLIPLPFLPDLPDPPTSSSRELKEYADKMKEWAGDLAERYTKDRSILMQDINRLAAPVRAKADPPDDPLGHGLAYNLLNDWPVNLAVSSLKKELQLANGADRGKVNITFKYLGVGDVVIGSGANVTYTADLAVSPDAAGGTVSYSGGYTIHTFNSSGTFTPGFSATADVLIVAGGGGGGGNVGGGGGAGGYREITGVAITPQAYTITVGAGGAGGNGAGTTNGSPGSDSSALGYTSVGGGGGRSFNAAAPAVGGSGGGGSGDSDAGIAGTAGQGNNGGSGTNDTSNYGGGGGGGAGAVGANATATVAGNGGTGTTSSIFGGTRGGGGGGGGYQTPNVTAGSGGSGGGGAGNAVINTPGSNGTANTGGGGGGGAGGGSGSGGTGGSGVVIIRYPTPPAQPNGLDAGGEAASTWYYVYMIVGEDGPEVTDNTANNLQPPLWRRGAKVASLLSTSATPALPPGFSRYRRVGMVRNNGSSDLYRFINAVDDDWFYWNEAVASGDFSVLSVTTSAVTYTNVSCAAVAPPTSRCILFNGLITDAGAASLLSVRNDDAANIAYAGSIVPLRAASGGVASAKFICDCSSAQVVEYRTDATTNDADLRVLGYQDIR